MTLLEMLAYVAILGVVVNLAVAVFVSSTRLSVVSNRFLAHLDVMEEVRRDFTDAVRESTGVCDQVGAYRSGNDQLVLRLPASPESQAVRRYAVFGYLKDERRLYRLVLAESAAGDLELERAARYRRGFAAVAFDYGGAGELTQARLVTLDLEPVREPRGNRPPVVYRYAAALRNCSAGVPPASGPDGYHHASAFHNIGGGQTP